MKLYTVLFLILFCLCALNAQELQYDTSVVLVNRMRIETTLTITNTAATAWQYEYSNVGWHSIILDGEPINGSNIPQDTNIYIPAGGSITVGNVVFFGEQGLSYGLHTLQSSVLDSDSGAFLPVGNIVNFTVYETYHDIGFDFPVQTAVPDSIVFVMNMTNNGLLNFGIHYSQDWIQMTIDGQPAEFSNLTVPNYILLQPGQTYTNRLVYNPAEPISMGMHEVRFTLQGLPGEPFYDYPQIVYVTVAEPSHLSDEIAVPMHLTAFPNPFTDKLNLALKSETPGKGFIRIYNTKGQLIRSEEIAINAGDNSYSWDGNDGLMRTAPRGMYIFKVSSGSSSKTIKSLKLQ
jgi:hypothetical protein